MMATAPRIQALVLLSKAPEARVGETSYFSPISKETFNDGGYTEWYYDTDSIRKEDSFLVGYYLHQNKEGSVDYEYSVLHLIQIDCLSNKLNYLRTVNYDKLWLKGKIKTDYEYLSDDWSIPDYGTYKHKVVSAMCKHKF